MDDMAKERLEIAKSTDLVEAAKYLGFTPVKIGRYFSLKEMDSIRIYNRSSWFRFSRRMEGGYMGGSQVEFLKAFCGMNAREAIKWLVEFAQKTQSIVACHIEKKEEGPRKEMTLPGENDNNSKLYDYLCSDRGISLKTVSWFVNRGLIYESSDYHNIVFMGNDKEGKTRFASLRGVYGKNGKGFKCDVAGNNKNYGFNTVCDGINCSNEDVKTVHVFEGAIDLMSYADLSENCNQNMIALGMLSDAPLVTFLDEHPGISIIAFHLDNDVPGREATERLMQKYYELDYDVFDEPAPEGFKDYNEYLQDLTLKEIELRR